MQSFDQAKQSHQEVTELTSLVTELVNTTSLNVFLTGRAGTGKTTLLKSILKTTHKRALVAAPTGIAAINAGGVTLHSLFQLPFGAFLPRSLPGEEVVSDSAFSTPQQLTSSIKMHTSKRKLIEKLELLIIDEVSMMRADLVDAVDTLCRHLRRRRDLPFGGLQVLFIGDLFQLPPVVKDHEWKILGSIYRSPYFFSSLVLEEHTPVVIELKKVYRQSDPAFISLLNKVRDNQLGPEEMALLTSRVNPGFERRPGDGFVQLTTHNHLSDSTNANFLEICSGRERVYRAMVEGDFPEHQHPMPEELRLKEGAQVMFIKNDISGQQRYFNGKTGVVHRLGDEGIEVSFGDGRPPVLAERHIWENKRYTLNAEDGSVEEKVLGSFAHFPLKLAWSITIHKSQGLTFEKAMVDASRAFAPGQVYVALSRLTSLEGLVLSAPIAMEQVRCDPALVAFMEREVEVHRVRELVNAKQQEYILAYCLGAFDFLGLMGDLGYHLSSYNKIEGRSQKQNHLPWAEALVQDFRKLPSVGETFCRQIKKILDEGPVSKFLLERVGKAIEYFEPIFQGFHRRVQDQEQAVTGLKGTKAYATELRTLAGLFYDQVHLMVKAKAIVQATLEQRALKVSEMGRPGFQPSSPGKKSGKLRSSSVRGVPRLSGEVRLSGEAHGTGATHAFGSVSKPSATSTPTDTSKSPATSNPSAPVKQGQEVSTYLQTLTLFQEHKSLEQVAKIRGLKVATLEGHLARYIEEGVIEVVEVVAPDRLKTIEAALAQCHGGSLAEAVARLGKSYGYGQVKCVLAHVQRKREDR